MRSTVVVEDAARRLAPSVYVDVDHLDRLAELTIELHMMRAKAVSCEHRLNEMLVRALNDGEDPREISEATGLAYDELLAAENNAFRSRLDTDVRRRLLDLIADRRRHDELNDDTHRWAPMGVAQTPRPY